MKSYIHTYPTRIFHFLLVIYVLAIFLISEEKNLLPLHVAIGYGILILIIFRIYFGFFGPLYSRFKDWPLSIKESFEFILNFFHPKEYISHNPLASFAILAIVINLFLVVISGMLVYGIQEGIGVVSFLNDSLYKDMNLYKDIHQLFSNILLGLIFIHISGVLVDRVLHKDKKTLNSIFNGYKNIKAKNSKLSNTQKIISSIFLTLAIITPLYLFSTNNILMSSKYKKIDYEQELEVFVEECASCHIIYPPHLLPKNAWNKIMDNLEEHFGDDASIDKDSNKIIREYLLKNSAQNSKKQVSINVLNTYIEEIAISENKYWKDVHKNLEKSLFKSKKVKTKSNCKACHTNFENGIIENRDIDIPKI